jgi:hypothetical protein
MASKIAIGDLLYDGHFYGIVAGYFNEDMKVYRTTWFYFDDGKYDINFPYGEATVLDYKDSFARWSTGTHHR